MFSRHKPKMPSEAALKEAKRLADELRQAWPTEFTLGSRSPAYPPLHFVADPDVPGMFYADVDPNFVMGR